MRRKRRRKLCGRRWMELNHAGMRCRQYSGGEFSRIDDSAVCEISTWEGKVARASDPEDCWLVFLEKEKNGEAGSNRSMRGSEADGGVRAHFDGAPPEAAFRVFHSGHDP